MDSTPEFEVLSTGANQPGPSRSRPSPSALALAAIIGLTVGATGMRAWDDYQARVRADQAIDVRVSLGADGGGTSERSPSRTVVSADLVLINAGHKPLTLVGFDVEGPGASFVPHPAGGPSTQIPQALPPGQQITNRIGLASDCAIPSHPTPRVTLVLRTQDGDMVRRPALIPDLENVWGRALLARLCRQPS